MSAPGFYSDMAADVYHADPAPEPSLSSSIAKTLISRSPAHAYAEHPKLGGTYEPDTSRKMDVGSCAHSLLLGRGAKIHVIDAKSYQTNAAKAERDDARERGEIPVLLADYELASDMVSAARSALDAAGEIAAFTDAQAELVAIAEDRGMWMRAMVDRFDEKNLVIWDYKTTSASAAPEAVGRLIESMGYDVSAAHYEHVFGLLRPEWRGRMTFRWLIQEAEPPYEATICTLDGTGREIGARKAAFAASRCQGTATDASPPPCKRLQRNWERMPATSSCMSTGFTKYCNAPASRPLIRLSRSARAVMSTVGTP